jgi:hypothetical protein
MNTTTPQYTLHLALTERKGDKTDRLIREMKKLSIKYDLLDEVTLLSRGSSKTLMEEDNTLTYAVSVPTPNSKKGVNIVAFLEQITQKMFDKYPVFTEPEARI